MNSIKKKFILGTANFGLSYGIAKKVVKQNEIKTITSFVKKKIKILDTALKYRIPTKKINLINNFKIITKLGYVKEKNIENAVYKKILKSLKEYKIKSFEAILLHDSRILENKDGARYVSILKELKKKKLCKSIGVSIYEPNEIKLVLKYFKPDLIQAPLNLFDQRLVKSKWYKYLIKNKIKIHVRSVFLKKVLLLDNSEIPKYFKRWRKYFTKYHELCRSSKITKIQACLNYVFQFKDIQGIVLGVDNIFQLNEIMKTQIIKDKLLVSKISSLGIRKKEIIDPRSWKL